MNEENTQSNKVGWITTAVLLIICVASVAVYVYLKGYELYIGGVVINNVTSLVGILLDIILLFIVIIECVKKIRNADESKARNKNIGYIIGIFVFFIIMIVFISQIIATDVVRSNKATIAEREIGNGKSVLLMENEESFSSSDEKFYEITVYYRDGIRLKKIGRQSEYYFSNNNMVKNEQFKVESSSDSVTIYYDYGELINGMKWQEEYSDNPPQYIDKEYKLK